MIQSPNSMQASCFWQSVRQSPWPLLYKNAWLFAMALVGMLTHPLGCPLANADSSDPPNILLILVDDMGYGDPGCFNAQSKIPTPNIDSLARDGMKFTDAHAPGPLCHMSRYGLMTGRYPFRVDVNKWRKEPLIESGETTIASLLRDAGYRTAMVGKWHLGFAENGYDRPLPGGPVDVGFQSYFGIRASTDIPPYFYIRGDKAVDPPTETIEARNSEGWSPIQGEFWRAGGIAPGMKLHDVLPRFTDEACQVIASHDVNGGKPLMLYVAYPAPHTPWLPSKEFQGKSGAGMYGDFAMMVDAMIGKLLMQLDQSGMSDDTLVIFTSDNGPVWYDEDVKRFEHDSSGGLRGMKADAWECGHRMPFIVRWPGVVKPGSQSEKTISFCDLLATLDELVDGNVYVDARAGARPQVGPDSFSFLSELTGQESTEPQRETLLVKGGKLMTIRRGRWKLIDGKGGGGFSRRGKDSQTDAELPGQLYDLKKDVGEMNNLHAERPDLVQSLKAEMAAIREAGRSRPKTTATAN